MQTAPEAKTTTDQTMTDQKEEKKEQTVYDEWKSSPSADTLNSIIERAEAKQADCNEFLFRAYFGGVEGKYAIAKDPKKALEYLRSGARAGSTLCRLNYGRHLVGSIKAGQSSTEEAKEAEELLMASKREAPAEGGLLLGLFYEATGKEGLAQHELNASADLGNGDAHFNLSMLKLRQVERQISELFEKLRVVRGHFVGCIRALQKTASEGQQ